MIESLATGSVALGLAAILFKSLEKRVDSKANKSDCAIHVKAITDSLDKGDEKFKTIQETNTKILTTLARIDERTKKQNGDMVKELVKTLKEEIEDG